MEYFAMIGLLFAPVVCLLCTGWFFVRWKNEHDDEALAQKNRKICRGFLIATVISQLPILVLIHAGHADITIYAHTSSFCRGKNSSRCPFPTV